MALETILPKLNSTFYHQTVNTSQIENYISQQSGLDLSPVFNQYLRDNRLPVFDYYQRAGKLYFRWNNVIGGFNMPLKVYLSDKETWLKPTTNWQEKELPNDNNMKVDANFYVAVMKE